MAQTVASWSRPAQFIDTPIDRADLLTGWLPWIGWMVWIAVVYLKEQKRRRTRTLVSGEHSVLPAAIRTSRTNKARGISAWRNAGAISIGNKETRHSFNLFSSSSSSIDLSAFLFLFSAALPAGPSKGQILSLLEINPFRIL